MSVQSSIILRLIEQIPDQHLRDQITAQYYHDVEAQSNFVQVRISELEIALRDQLATSLGATNDMISDNAKTSRENAAALAVIHETIEELRRAAQAGFQDTDRRLTDVEQSLADRPAQLLTFYDLIERVSRLEDSNRKSNEA
jgi:hypothetical protein